MSITQRLLIARVVNLQMQLLLFDKKLADGEVFTPHDLRTFSGISNAFKNALMAVGFKPVAVRQPTLAEHIAAIEAQQQEAAAAPPPAPAAPERARLYD